MGGALYRLGKYAVRQRRLVVLVWLVVAVSATVSSQIWGGKGVDNYSVPGAESQHAVDLLFERFPEQAGSRAQLVFHIEEGRLQDEPYASAIAASIDRVRTVEHITGEPLVLPASLLNPTSPVADRTTLAQVLFDRAYSDLDFSSIDALHAALQPAEDAGIQTEVGGDLVFGLTKPATSVAEGVGVIAAIVILLFAFGSLAGMGLPIGIALFGLATGTAFVSFLALVMDVAGTAPILGSMIGIGVGIDYALFIVSRHRQHLVAGMTVEEAAGRANATSGQAVVFAGGTVVIAICGLVLAGIPFVTSMGFAAAVIVAVMVVASVTLLPALLGFAGERIAIPTVGYVRRKEEAQADRMERLVRLGADAPRSGWERLADRVSAKPWRYLLVGVTILLVLAAPMTKMRLGQSDAGNYSEDLSIRRAFDLVNEAFGPGFNGPLLVSVDLDPADAAVPDQLTAAIGEDPAVSVAAPPMLNDAGDAAIILVVPVSPPQAKQTTELVHRLRDELVPSVMDGHASVAYVGGVTSTFTDLGDKVKQRLPIFIGGVVGLSFILLMAVFRSVLVPLKAAVMNLLSVGASYGIIVAVFQWGWLKTLVGLHQPVPIVSVIPMFMFAVLFGLSMDYEVFLLSRVREEYVRTKDNTFSVIVGLASTARVITSAALIMIFVFLGFVAGEDPTIKMMGLGLAVAVLVDATIVRMFLVPASMRLLGDANWWFPAWLDRLLPNLDIEGTAGLPEPELRPDFVPVGMPTLDELSRAAAVDQRSSTGTSAAPPAPARRAVAKKAAPRSAGTAPAVKKATPRKAAAQQVVTTAEPLAKAPAAARKKAGKSG